MLIKNTCWLIAFFSLLTISVFSQKSKSLDISVYLSENKFLLKKKTSKILGGSRKTNEKIQSTPSIGIQLIGELHYSENIAFNIGLNFTQLKAKQTIDGLIFSSDIDPNTGVVSSSSLVNNMKFSYIGLPLGVRYIHSAQTNHLYGGIGIELVGQISSREVGVIYYGNGDQEQLTQVKSDLSALNYFGNFYIGYGRSLSKNIILYFSPFLKFGLGSSGETYLNKSTSRYFSYGIATGLKLNL